MCGIIPVSLGSWEFLATIGLACDHGHLFRLALEIDTWFDAGLFQWIILAFRLEGGR